MHDYSLMRVKTLYTMKKSYIGPVQSFVIHKKGCDEHLCKRVMTAHINIIFPFKAYIPS